MEMVKNTAELYTIKNLAMVARKTIFLLFFYVEHLTCVRILNSNIRFGNVCFFYHSDQIKIGFIICCCCSDVVHNIRYDAVTEMDEIMQTYRTNYN